MLGWPNINWVKLLPYLVAVPLIFLAGVMWDADGRDDRAQRHANQVTLGQILACATDKASLYEEIRNARSVNASNATRFERVLSASDQEKAAFRADMTASVSRETKLRDAADEAMKRWDNARAQIEKLWGDGRISAAIACGVLESPGCPALSGRAPRAANDRGGALSGGPSAGPAGGTVVPAGADGRSGDGRVNQ